MSSRQRKYQKEMAEQGLCTMCGKTAVVIGYCAYHRSIVLERRRKWYWERGGKERMKSKRDKKKNEASNSLLASSVEE